MAKPRYLTKSRFKLALECETKLFYTGKKEYANQKMGDSFLEALAEGGYQVGELAKCYYPGGHDITTLDYEDAERQTNELLKQDNVIIFEPAISFNNLFIRVDVLVKNGNNFELIEVKAKSFDKNIEDPFHNKNGTLKSTWRPYLYDVAFQKHVLSQAFPDSTIASYLMMADKNAECPTDGLNQKFRIVRDESNRKGVKVSNTLTVDDLKDRVLTKISVDHCVSQIYEGTAEKDKSDETFIALIERLATKYEVDEKLESTIGSKCRSCEFKCNDGESKSGYEECWSKALGWTKEDFKESTVLDVWNFRKKDKLIAEGVIKISDLNEDDISPKDDAKPGVSASQRQWLQVEMEQSGTTTPYIDYDGLSYEMSTWKYPLHFIDFETTAMAIPFNKGRKPYEGIAFQFSHHIVHKDGAVEHAGQYLNTEVGIFPNYDFVRELRSQLDNDNGTIFRYAPHENTYLNMIYRQLQSDESDIEDREELCQFIKSITKSVGSSSEKWDGDRCMVDLWDIVKRHYYAPHTKGSNSIKAVLPAILQSSDYLQKKYAQVNYGTSDGIPSLNFKGWQWLQIKDGQIADPYSLLPKLFEDVSVHDLELLSSDDELKNGGAALTAYARMQFSEMSDYERKALEQGLLKYCELDTFAMVLIYEGWREILKAHKAKEAA
ncbi:MAG: DUF2779 domain-containing protein [Bdellovibrionaceae bacterium]|jgi:hypothetical protein|nr:DUF2779 domain-containing protein [Pseudobdellovibrionaceae bacterium]